MTKLEHEIRDPIHVFIKLDEDERRVLNSRPFQRLRHIHQLAMTFLVYPGATHRRFEHSLGVMELAGRIFDIVTHPVNVTDEIRNLLPMIADQANQLPYWRRAIRMAGLCHDLGHLPFSHAAEKELLPEGCSHETLTAQIIRSDEMRTIWETMTPPLRADDVLKLAVGPKEAIQFDARLRFNTWEDLLSDIIIGDAFGADRIDYLLRDAHHSGVAYGKFDHYRLIDTLRILPSPPSPSGGDAGREPSLGVEEGGIQSAEALLLARYFMFTQLYLHPVRRAYDIHLQDFLKAWLGGGHFSTDIERHLEITDNEVMSAILKAARDHDTPGHDPARRIVNREHFRCLYRWNPVDVEINPEAGDQVFEAAKTKFGEPKVRRDRYKKGGAPDFPVKTKDERIVSSLGLSQTLKSLPFTAIDLVFIDPTNIEEARTWLNKDRQKIITPPKENENE